MFMEIKCKANKALVSFKTEYTYRAIARKEQKGLMLAFK